MAGMLVRYGDGRLWYRLIDGDGYEGDRDAVPDITDPWTKGGILQLVRDAHGIPWLIPAPLYHDLGCYGWRLPIRIDGALMPVCKTEAEALLRALQAAPEAS